MLVLTRKAGERIVFRTASGVMGTIEVRKHSDGDRVKLAFDFPGDVEIYRAEILTPEQAPTVRNLKHST